MSQVEEQPYDDRHHTPPLPKRTPMKVPNMAELTTREYDIVLNIDEGLSTVVEE